jgi:hypothetical protein
LPFDNLTEFAIVANEHAIGNILGSCHNVSDANLTQNGHSVYFRYSNVIP